MVYKRIKIKDLSKDFSDSEAYLEVYSLEYSKGSFEEESYTRPGMVIVPGGSYVHCSDREAEPVALRMLCEGFNTFVVRYTCSTKYPTPHKELAFFINYIRKHYQEFNLIDKNLVVTAFSAGAHLAASFTTLYKKIAQMVNVNPSDIKPLALVLGYPVISCKEGITHIYSANNITGGELYLVKLLSVEDHINGDFPPTYVFTTKDDRVVPYQNTVLLIEQLKKNNIKYRSHIFVEGEHGGSLYTRGVYYTFDNRYKRGLLNRDWVNEASDFLFEIIEND